jgi:hypothetical protein
MEARLRRLTEVLDELASRPPSDPDAVVTLHAQLARLDAVAASSAAAFDAGGTWSADGATSAAAWIAARCRLPRSVAARRVRLGRAVRTMARTEQAWLAGDVSAAHVRVLADAGADDAALLDAARTKRWPGFCREVAYWRQLHDEDRADDEAQRQVDDRRVHLSQSFQGTWFLDGVLDPIDGAIVAETLRRIEHELFEDEWSETRRALGRDPALAELPRLAARRRADALVEMATRARTAAADGRRPEPLFTVFVDYETFAGRLCQLADGTVVTPGSLVRWLDRAWAERVVFGPRSRVLDVGARQRLFTGADRRAVLARDLAGCLHDTCDETGEHLQIDHVVPWSAGGPTVQDNGRVACATHNRRRHSRSSRGP